MASWTRRDWLRTTTAASGALLLPNVTGLLGQTPVGRPAPAAPALTRDRLLADFGWRFHLGHADDVAKDFNFGRAGGNGIFGKSGSFLPGGGRGTPGIGQWGFDTDRMAAGGSPARLGRRPSLR